MKKLLFIALCMGFMASCSTDEVQLTEKSHLQRPTQPEFLDTELPPLPDGRRPVTLSYWYNGLYMGNHSWTNGNCTYYQVVVAPGTPSAYMMLNHLTGSVYWVTTHWTLGSQGCGSN